VGKFAEGKSLTAHPGRGRRTSSCIGIKLRFVRPEGPVLSAQSGGLGNMANLGFEPERLVRSRPLCSRTAPTGPRKTSQLSQAFGLG
jgi:hypothetical protein